ncbi:FixH family protein [Polaromonas sp. P1(28)-13]|nr:FixH family protein [Polaromonas sp. P1(28)-13]
MNPVNKAARNVSWISTARPWWKEPYVWLVIAGPLSAVLACVVTAFYIMQGPDALVSDDAYREGIAISQQVQTAQPPMQPALTGRNHSATGGKRDEQP